LKDFANIALDVVDYWLRVAKNGVQFQTVDARCLLSMKDSSSS